MPSLKQTPSRERGFGPLSPYQATKQGYKTDQKAKSLPLLCHQFQFLKLALTPQNRYNSSNTLGTVFEGGRP